MITSSSIRDAVSRTIQRFTEYGEAWSTPIGDATFKLRCNTLRDVIVTLDDPVDHHGFQQYPFGAWEFCGISDEESRSISVLETLISASWKETPENLYLQAFAMEVLAWVRIYQGDFSGCWGAFIEANKLADGAGPEMRLYRCEMILNLVNFLSECNKIDESMDWARKAAKLALSLIPEEQDDSDFVQCKLAEILSKNWELIESLALAIKAVVHAENYLKIDNHCSLQYRLIEALSQLAVVYCRRGELDAVDATLLRATAISVEPEPTVLDCLEKPACICEERGDFAVGIAFRCKAVALARTYTTRLHLAKLLGDLGVALTRRGLWRKTCSALDEAFVIYDDMPKRERARPWKAHFIAYRVFQLAIVKGTIDKVIDYALNFNNLLNFIREEDINRIISVEYMQLLVLYDKDCKWEIPI